MAVFTALSAADAGVVCATWRLGTLRSLEPTPHGIENSNFFIVSEDEGRQREWVLTISERPFAPTALETLARLDAAGLPVPMPQPDRHGNLVAYIKGQPALLARRFPGKHPEHPSPAQCAAIGGFLTRMHHETAGLDAPGHPRDARWIAGAAERHRPHLGPRARQRLDEALAVVAAAEQRHDWQTLPAGIVHGDLFRDNALFDGGDDGQELSAVIDFHHAARAPLLFDLAVTANDWCTEANGHFDQARLAALERAYWGVRPPSDAERGAWPDMTVLAALRFWLARLEIPRKPPLEMEQILAARLRDAAPLTS